MSLLSKQAGRIACGFLFGDGRWQHWALLWGHHVWLHPSSCLLVDSQFVANTSVAMGHYNTNTNTSVAMGHYNTNTNTSVAMGHYDTNTNTSVAMGHYNNIPVAIGHYDTNTNTSVATGHLGGL